MTDIGPKRFRLIFRGELESGTDPDQARALFRERFRVRDTVLEECFSGRKVALRSRLSEAEAFHLQAELQTHGLITRIEATDAGKPSAAPSPQEPPATARQPEPAAAPAEADAPPGRPPSHEPPCRECGRGLRPTALHCPWCGARQEDRSRIWPLMAALAAVVLLLVPVLALVAMPLLQQSRVDEQVEAALSQGRDTTGQVREFMRRTGFRPNSNLDAGLPRPEELARPPLASITVSQSALITLQFQPGLAELGNKTIVFQPTSGEQGKPAWLCRPGTLEAKYLPPDCQDANSGGDSPPRGETVPPPAPTSPDGNPAPSSVNHAQTDAVARRVISEEIASSRPILDRMLRYHASRGQWPQSNAALGLQAPEQMGSSAVREIRINPGGELAMDFIPSVAGHQAHTALVFYRGDNRWLCRSTMRKEILPQDCRQDPGGSRRQAEITPSR